MPANLLIDAVQNPLLEAVVVACLIFAADHRPDGVDRAQHGFPVEGCAPAVLKARHDPPAPLVLFGQFGRDVVVPHQHHFQPAAAGTAGAARND